MIYTNNSIIPIADIGRTDRYNPVKFNDAVQCITDRKPCCRSDVYRGMWLSPSGAEVPSSTNKGTGLIYRSRDDNGAVKLNRVGDGLIPNGLYCCIVPDATDTNKTLCVNLSKRYTTFVIIIG